MSSAPVGRGKPPKATQFRKGQSGNPRGRPRNRKRQVPYDHVLGQMVTIREDGRERRVTAAEAFLLQLTKKGLEGCAASARSSLQSIENARASRPDQSDADHLLVRLVFRSFGLCSIIEDLGMGVLLNPTSKANVRLKLKPWLVELALERMNSLRLTLQEQQIVWNATHSPGKVCWPEWWQVRE